MNYVNTVTGSVAASELGRTLMHEHFLFGFCGFQPLMMPAHTASTQSLTQQQTNADVTFVFLRRSPI